MSDMKITALAPWFGNKRTMAPRIVAELGKHSAFWEPFCGGMAILMEKPESSHEHVNDLHGDLINLARVIQHPQLGAVFYRRCRRIIMHEQAHADAKAICADQFEGPPDLERAVQYFVWSWFGRNGVSGTQSCNNTSFARRWTPHGGHGGKRFQSAVESIPAWRRRMRRVTILRMDAFDMLDRIEDCAGTVIYADPPYLVKGAKYVHDFDDAAHQRLADVVARFKRTRVVVSYYAHPRLADLYPGWTVVNCPMPKSMNNQGQRGEKGEKIAPEVLLINGPSFTSEATTTTAASDLFGATA